MQHLPTKIAVLVLGLSMLSGLAHATETEIEAKSVWLPEVEELYDSDVTVPTWLSSPTEFTIVRGLAGKGKQSAETIAIRDAIVPKLTRKNSHEWTEWERAIAEREIRHWLRNSNVIVKRFEQPFVKTVDDQKYEAFTREALLLDLSDKNLSTIRRRTGNAVSSKIRNTRGTIGIAITTIAFLLFTCWFGCTVVDRLTRGYYIGWLRLAAATTFFVSAGLAIHVTRIVLRAL